jgi:hypothetical protein
LQDYFTVSGEINGNDLRRTPVGKPQTVLVPPGLLTKGHPGHQDLELRLRRLVEWRHTLLGFSGV